MSTFDGVVAEFPDIRIDRFRQSSSQNPPLAYFLSHVHTDHTVGLETCNSPFVYCSPATRDILLRLEKYPHRMNFAKGILESRKQTFRQQKKLLKAIPLETPTVIELSPGRSIRVTLFDANHCIGAVMFLIEGDGKAVLYTGDIRSEAWWVDSLKRNPLLLPYVSLSGKPALKRLDCMYLDTTFVAAGKEDPYKEFVPKAEGLAELLGKLAKYPKDTLFYFDSWTFGYEDVWQTLSAYLNSQIHVDDYRYGLYAALGHSNELKAFDTYKLMGFYFGNHYQQGYLTKHQTRLHSCEKGAGCDIFSRDFVRITPIITRHNGMELAELGAGGGHGDLDQHHELELGDTVLVTQLMALCAARLQGQPEQLTEVLDLLATVTKDGAHSLALDGNVTAAADADRDLENDSLDLEDLPIEQLVPVLAATVARRQQQKAQKRGAATAIAADVPAPPAGLPKRITFPYSRHSSYAELCWLVEAFKPRDIYPCTIETTGWHARRSMSYLFGHIYCDPVSFSHDQNMLARLAAAPIVTSKRPPPVDEPAGSPSPTLVIKRRKKEEHLSPEPRKKEEKSSPPPTVISERRISASVPTNHSHENIPRVLLRQEAYKAALDHDGGSWSDIFLVSTSGHQRREEEL